MSGTTYLAGKKQKIFIGSTKITKAYVGGKQVYSSGSLVTYNVDGTVYTEEVEEGSDVLHPTSFTPSKTNYTFYGWTQTSGSTQREESLVATGDPMTLYAIFLLTEVTFAYTGYIQSFAAKKGVTYQLKVWGAQGGSASSSVYVSGKGNYDVSGTGANGGYAVGNKAVTANTTWYVGVGGMGASNYKDSGAITANGGYNGGGSGKNTGGENRGAGGGGATHIGLSNALLKNTTQANVLIAAGGGGGAGVGGSRDDTHQMFITYGDAGNGGGTNGGNSVPYGTDKSSTWSEYPVCTGGSQTAGGTASLGNNPGSYGQGGSGYAGGGGGLYGGGATGDYGMPAGGGSGYTGGVTSGSMSNGQRSGNGYATIVILNVS